MLLTLDFPPKVVQQLQAISQARQISAEQLAFEFVVEGLADNLLTPEQELAQLVREVQSLPPNPDAIIPAEGSLLDALQSPPKDAEFDLESWQQQWAVVEAEMKSITRQNSIAEGRS